MRLLESYIKEILKEECWPERIEMPIVSQEDIKKSLEYFYRWHLNYASDKDYYDSVRGDMSQVNFELLKKRKNPPIRKEIGNIGEIEYLSLVVDL